MVDSLSEHVAKCGRTRGKTCGRTRQSIWHNMAKHLAECVAEHVAEYVTEHVAERATERKCGMWYQDFPNYFHLEKFITKCTINVH